MSEPEKRDRNKSSPLQRRRRLSFIGNDDDTDNPDFEKGSWAAILVVLILLGIGIALTLAIAN